MEKYLGILIDFKKKVLSHSNQFIIKINMKLFSTKFYFKGENDFLK